MNNKPDFKLNHPKSLYTFYKMCGRYAQAKRPSQIQWDLETNSNMPVDSAPSDNGPDAPRTTHNFAPGNRGLVYRANTPSSPSDSDRPGDNDVSYKLQTMKWGLVPHWMKRSPDYKFTMRTINCRAESLEESGGLWASMKTHKRCIVLAQGFFEWKTAGKEKIPHFVKRTDGQLLCMASLWDSVRYDNDAEEELFTYTIITTKVNEQLRFLHDRMPVVLEPGSKEMREWLNPGKTSWGEELQRLLRPFQGGLEVYPVTQEVGKVGTDSPMYVVPVDSKENKRNIANFFRGVKKEGKEEEDVKGEIKEEEESSDVEVKTEVVGDDFPTVKTEPTDSDSVFVKPEIPFLPDKGAPMSRKRPRKRPPNDTLESAHQTKKQATGRRVISATENTRTKTISENGPKGNSKITSFFGKD